MKIFDIFKRKKKTYSIGWKHSLNNEIVIYPSEKGWEKINSMFSEKYVQDRMTEDGGYQDLMWTVIEDLHELFYHGSDYLETTTIEIIDKW
jgi:hypothetical protein